MTDPLAVLTILMASVAAAEWLAGYGLGRKLGAAVIVIGLGAIWGNIGIVPSASTELHLYDGIFRIVGPISIFLLLLDVRLTELRRAGVPMLLAFLCVIGVHCELATVAKLGGLEPNVITMGSNANVMGATTAPAVAESIGRHDLALSGVLAGGLGNALGTYLGFIVARLV